MKGFIFTAIFLLVASQAMAEFSAHLVREKDSVMPVMSVNIDGEVFDSSLLIPSVGNIVTTLGGEVDASAGVNPLNGIHNSLSRLFKPSETSVVLAFEAHPDVATVAVIIEGNVSNLDSIMSGGTIYEFSLNSGEWFPYVFTAGGGDDSAQWNTPVDHRNPHLDIRGVGDQRLVSFKGPLAAMAKAPVAILCFDANGNRIKDGVLYSDWQYEVVYRGSDHFETPDDLIFGYTLVQHNSAGSLGYIFNEKLTPVIEAPVSTIPSPEDSGFATSEIHVGLVVNTPQIIQLGTWSKGVGSEIKVLDVNRKEITTIPVPRESDGIGVFDLPFTKSGLHKVIFCFQKDPVFTTSKSPIHLFIRKQGDPHLRPFTVQDSIIMD